MILKAALIGNPIIRAQAQSLEPSEITLPQTQRLIDDMIKTMHEYDGVGIAANQVHIGKRIAILEVSDAHPRYPSAPKISLQVLINPEIIEYGKKIVADWEGCLSVPGLRGQVPRSVEIRVRALDRDGNRVEFTADDFHARIIQHECDHLNGRVYLDRMNDLKTLSFLDEYRRYAQSGK
ncbi:MAG: peptide deformylase [Elusimicrobia bacterium]|nr:MAG: peptide deformylase [Elusimicrobiota bacterium]